MTYQDVLHYWFGEPAETAAYQRERNALWFGGGPEVDDTIRQRFGGMVEEAAAGRLSAWEAAPDSCLALLILLDQFPLNMFRSGPRAYQLGDLALEVAERALARGFDRQVPFTQQIFYYLPLEHAEDLAAQEECVRLFTAQRDEAPNQYWRDWAQSSLDFAVRHLVVVKKFGRFPHRNEALGRASTPEELEFLKGGRPF